MLKISLKTRIFFKKELTRVFEIINGKKLLKNAFKNFVKLNQQRNI